ncbi:glycosyl transferase family 8 [Liquorilactobacillus aquaticus DSM 21051]|uniref:Glycosyl transferase family 8 n=1 Tax=Liquorilactobacillus aquaticus DSM 21051 TaxID=1423725 RepID=A0A0R2CU06_9LACO|nr:glycosyltransferase family 8 protein [Liquorilactobacillus aquaticus]KRM94880.1 glycosyl transferase family 8 [Liquorilactobacillus aquaticus DSM 21051]
MNSKSNYEIVYASDDSFASVLGVSIFSLFYNNECAKNINLTILDTNISQENKLKIENVCRKFNRSLPRWIKAVDVEKILGINVKADRGSLSQYARLFLQHDFPLNINKILYLDCDTMVTGSLDKLWYMDLGNNIIAALKDAFSKYYRKNINLNYEDIMFNSGVMLIDLQKWREFEIESKLKEFLMNRNGKVQQGDQGVLNSILSKNTVVLDPKFNLISIFYDLNYKEIEIYRKPVNFYTENEIDLAKKNAVIVHFTSSFSTQRPWIKGCKHALLGEWLNYKRLSPWKNDPLRVDDQGLIKKLIKFMYLHLPDYVALKIAGIFQIYLRPLKNKFFL